MRVTHPITAHCSNFEMSIYRCIQRNSRFRQNYRMLPASHTNIIYFFFENTLALCSMQIIGEEHLNSLSHEGRMRLIRVALDIQGAYEIKN